MIATESNPTEPQWAPERIWLQREEGYEGTHTWCASSIDGCEQAEYVRVDVAVAAQLDFSSIARKLWRAAQPLPAGGGHIKAIEMLERILAQEIGQAVTSSDAADPQYCSKCSGAGIIHTGISEASTTQCRDCYGTGYAVEPSNAKVEIVQPGDDADTCVSRIVDLIDEYIARPGGSSFHVLHQALKGVFTELTYAKQQVAAKQPAPLLGAGEVAIVVNAEPFQALMDGLARADDKGYLPDAIYEEWHAFNWRAYGTHPANAISEHGLMDRFFWRIDGFDLTPKSKLAGFCLAVSTDTLRELRAMEVSSEERQALADRARQRLGRADVLSKQAVKACDLLLVGSSACPKVFTTDPTFGASIGADPEEVSRLLDKDALARLGPSLTYTPHNCDAPAQAIALMILVQTWAEWAHDKLLLQAYRARHG